MDTSVKVRNNDNQNSKLRDAPTHSVPTSSHSDANQNPELYNYWKTQSLPFQIANIGSEVSRALKNHNQNLARFKSAYERALELFDLTLQCENERNHSAGIKEITLAKNEFCDYFNQNHYHTDPEKMLAYYNQFAPLARNINQPQT